MIGLVCGVAGLFVLPFLGLPIGFAVGLLASEFAGERRPDGGGHQLVGAEVGGVGHGRRVSCALCAAATLLVGILVRLFA